MMLGHERIGLGACPEQMIVDREALSFEQIARFEAKWANVLVGHHSVELGLFGDRSFHLAVLDKWGAVCCQFGAD
jgi:hypothetical protein